MFVKNIRLILDNTLGMQKQVNSICNSCYYQIRNIGLIPKCINDETGKILVQGFTHTHTEREREREREIKVPTPLCSGSLISRGCVKLGLPRYQSSVWLNFFSKRDSSGMLM